METRVLVAAAVVGISLLPISGGAQSQSPAGEITFQVPLQLTRLEPDITKVRVQCSISSLSLGTRSIRGQVSNNSIMKQVEIPVTNGQVITNATVVVAIPAGALGKNYENEGAEYECSIMGYSVGKPATGRGTGTTGEGWNVFNGPKTPPSFQIAPAPANIVGKFLWLGGEAAPKL